MRNRTNTMQTFDIGEAKTGRKGEDKQPHQPKAHRQLQLVSTKGRGKLDDSIGKF